MLVILTWAHNVPKGHQRADRPCTPTVFTPAKKRTKETYHAE